MKLIGLGFSSSSPASCVAIGGASHAYTLMTNHYHLLIETQELTLSRGMQKLDGDYARGFNRRYRRVGHLFQDRFRSHAVEQETYLLELARYIVLNPVRAGMVKQPGEWPWSSYAATAGLSPVPPWLETGLILARFDEWDRGAAQSLYRAFVAGRIGKSESIWENLVANAYLGGEAFIARMEQLTRDRQHRAHDAKKQRSVRSLTLEVMAFAIEEVAGHVLTPKTWRNEAARHCCALLAPLETTSTFIDIGKRLSISASGARALSRRAAHRFRADESFRKFVESVRLTIVQRRERRDYE